MTPRRRLVLAAVFVAAAAGLLAAGLGAFDQPDEATVAVVDADGAHLSTVEVRVADSYRERYTGLSDTPSLADGEGMLFVHAEEATHTYVMRRMEYGLDIVFVAADGSITTIHQAPPPSETPGSDLVPYRGTGKYVLEVPYGFTNRTGIDVGDTVQIPEQHRNTDG